MAGIVHLVARRASNFLKPFELSSRLLSTGPSGTDDDAPPPIAKPSSTRGEQARGAMRDYLRNVGTSGSKIGGENSAGGGGGAQEGGASLWERLRRDLGSASSNRYPRSSAAPTSASSQHAPSSQGVRPPRQASSLPVSNSVSDQSSRISSSTERMRVMGEADVSASSEGTREINVRKFNKVGKGGIPSKAFGKKGKSPGGGYIDSEDTRESEREGGGNVGAIPPAIQALLFDSDYFEREARKGSTIDTSDMDGVDAFMANFFMESAKSNTHEYRAVLESSKLRRTVLPQPRPMQQLIGTMTPNIFAAPSGSRGFALGVEAWGVVSKNTCYSDKDRDYIANSIAREAEKILAYASKAASQRNNVKAVPDMIFQAGFRKGLPGIEEEKRRRAMEETKPVDKFEQAETDWKQKAVISEDDL